MRTGLFDSVKGSMIHYFIRPNDAFVLNSLEKLDADEYLYRLLREEGYERIFFIDIGETNCAVWAFDKLSYWASVKPREFANVDMRNQNAVSSFLEQAEGGGTEKAAKPGLDLKFTKGPAVKKPAGKTVPEIGRSQMQTFATEAEFRSFMTNRIAPALNARNVKSAVVIPMELFEKQGYLAETTIATIRYAQKHNNSKNNIIVLTTPRKDNMINCLDFPKFRELHYWVPEVLRGLSAGQERVEAALDALRREGILVLADKICADEIANLLLRKKLIEKDKRFFGLQVSKVYSLAELVAEHCRMEKDHFQTFKSFKMHDFIRQLDRRLDDDSVAAELVEKSAGLIGRAPKAIKDLSAVALERVTGQEVARYEMSEEEMRHDLDVALCALKKLIGLSEVKTRIERQLNTVRAYGSEKGPGHFIFTGNPGTGKTEVARLMGRIFKAMGLLKKGHLVECKKADLVAEHVGGSAIKTRKKCEEALDGVLFVDEAYLLVNTEPTGNRFASAFDEEAYTEIMTFMDNNRDRVCVIFAGYRDKMRIFREANPGMPGRIGEDKIISFPDYTAEELFEIFALFAGTDDDGFALSAEFAREIRTVITQMVKNKTETFSNAREMRTLFDRCRECAAQRFVQTGNADLKYTLTVDDIPEELYLKASEDEFDSAMADLNELIGLEEVKETLTAILDTKLIYEEERYAGHYVFSGNPGTGKTEVARKLGRIFKAMGMLRSGHVVECRKADLVAGAVGQTAIKTRQKCEEALGGILFVDEAYELVNLEPTGSKFSSTFDEEAYTEIMAFMENNRHQLCVIFAGYANHMEKFLDANDGMRSRVTKVIHFPDYTEDELVRILALMAGKEGFTFAPGFEDAARNAIAVRKKECAGKFANGREMRELFGKFKQNAAGRMKQLRFENRLEEMNLQKYILTPEDALVGSMKEQREDISVAMADLTGLIGLEEVKQQVRAISNKIRYPADRTKDIVPGHYIFAGNPGTGKTEVARLMARILKAIGVLTKDSVVEVSRNDLVAGYIGQTATKTMDRCREALGGVLFVDEAYTLISGNSEHDFGKESLDTIMKFMEDNRNRVCVIFAGYEEPMMKLMEVNVGFGSRITEIIRFPDYSADELVQIMHFMAARQNLELAPDFVEKASKLLAYRVATKTKTFGNAREVRKLLNEADGNRANRIAWAVENGADPDTIRMNLLLAADLGLGRSAANNTPNKKGVASSYRQIPGAPIRELAPLYGGEVLNNRIKLAAATDSAILFIRTNTGYGTAFLISPDGYALTCNHVISGADKIQARFRMLGRAGGADSWHDCEVVNTKMDLDIALIKLDGENFPYLSLAPEDRVIQKGEEFILSGYPFGKRTQKDVTTYQGYVASTERQTDDNGFVRYNIGGEAKSGNSGSPLIALSDGRVIGILQGSITERTSEILTEEINHMRPVQYFWEEFVN